MKTKNKIFDMGLFSEGLRKLRNFGVLMLVILTFEAIIIPVSEAASRQHDKLPDTITEEYIAERGDQREVKTLFDDHFFLILSFSIIAPISVLILFGFLNKRSSSDFYHSLPHTRLCLYLSFFAAVMAWTIFIIVFTSGVSVLFHAVFPKLYLFDYTSILPLILNMTAASFAVAAAVTISMSVTGTLFSNIVVALLIIFLPRFIIMTCKTAIYDSVVGYASVPLLVKDKFMPIFEYNIPAGFVLNYFGVYTYRTIDPIMFLTSAPCGIYTFVLGLLYMLGGILAFSGRKSEAAEKSAPNRIMQSVYRISVTMTLCTLITGSLYSRDLDFDAAVIFYCIAIIIYFAYELITTRSLKSLYRAIPGLFVVLLCNLILVASMFLGSRAVLMFYPENDDIKTIEAYDEYEDGINGYYYDNSSAVWVDDYLASKAVIDDPEAIDIIAADIRNSIDVCKTLNGKYIGVPDNSFAKLKITTKYGSVYYRQIYIPKEDIGKVSEIEKFSELIPKPAGSTASLYVCNPYDLSYIAASGEESEILFKIFEKEFYENSQVNFIGSNKDRTTYFEWRAEDGMLLRGSVMPDMTETVNAISEAFGDRLIQKNN